MGQTQLGAAIRRPPRRDMSKRYRQDLFLAFERWGYDQRGWAARTRYTYLQRAKAADAWLHENCNVYLTWASAEQLRDYLFSTPPHAGNRNTIRSALVGYGDFAVEQGFRPDNPARGLPRLKVPTPHPKALDVEQARRVVVMADTFDPMYRALILMYLFTGVRRNEARLLEWRHVFPEWITVLGKGSKERDVALPPPAADALFSWRLSCPDPRWCFPSPRHRGRPVSEDQIRLVINELAAMCNIDHLTPHVFRHTMATRMVERGWDVTRVQVALGHSNLQTTQIYTRVRPEQVKEAMFDLDFAGPVVIPEAESG